MKSKRTNFFQTAFYTILFALSLCALFCKYSFAVNTDESSQYTLFLVEKGKLPKKANDYIVFHAPKNSRYKTQFVKKIAGMPGDKVSVIGKSFFISGKFIGTAKDTDSNGNSVEILKSVVIPKASYFVYSTKENSYDSKYEEIGLIPSSAIVGRAISIF